MDSSFSSTSNIVPMPIIIVYAIHKKAAGKTLNAINTKVKIALNPNINI